MKVGIKAGVMSVAMIAGLLAGGCQQEKKTETAASNASAQPASMGVLNSKCPLMPDHPIDQAVTVAYGEGKVAFCCKGCIPQWNKLTDEQKAARLAKSK